MSRPLPIAKAGDTEICLLPALANRHGLITGATGTGKTVTLQGWPSSFPPLACRCSWPTSRATLPASPCGREIRQAGGAAGQAGVRTGRR